MAKRPTGAGHSQAGTMTMSEMMVVQPRSAPATRGGAPARTGDARFRPQLLGLGAAESARSRPRETLHMTGFQQALLVAVPVLVGSLGRIPVGALIDRFGGRTMFAA